MYLYTALLCLNIRRYCAFTAKNFATEMHKRYVLRLLKCFCHWLEFHKYANNTYDITTCKIFA